MLKLFRLLDDYLLSFIAGFLIFFIPLYPKLPLYDVLPGYIVRIRLEDILVGLSFVLWLVFLIRGKIKLSDNPLFKPILIYLAVGLASIISAIFVIRTVPQETIHIQKILLHYFRRIEYFSLFFIFFSSIKNLKQIKVFLLILLLTVLAVSLYGFGQRYYYWPAFSTMNREFAKGWMLYLTEHARVLSTFGGHYDLAAYIMMVLVILWSLFFGLKKLILKLAVFILIGFAFWTLILTASRTSFIAYLVGLFFMFLFWAFKKGILWSIPRYFTVTLLSVVVMLSFGDLSERFTKLLKIDERISGLKSMLLSPIGRPPGERALFLENNPQAALSEITSRSDQPPTIGRPSDVYEDIPLNKFRTKEGTISAQARTYSRTAFMYDLSTAIRFDALWPMAIKGFKANPILGSGYSTLNKSQLSDFTEAESTDNDYLRALGETGILGFIAFYGTLILAVYYIWRNLNILQDPLIFAFNVGFIGLVFGLLTNAVYIDVFESSKVAFSFWGLTGLAVGSVHLMKKEHQGEVEKPKIADLNRFLARLKTKMFNFLKSDKFKLILILILAFWVRLYKIDTPLADWHSWRQADTSAVSRNYVRSGINLLYPTFDDLSNVASGKDNPKGYRMVEFPIYNFLAVFTDKMLVGYNLEIKERLTSVLLSLGTLVFIFLLVRKYSGLPTALFASFFWAVIPYNIYFSRVILPEPALVFFSTGMLYFADRMMEKSLGQRPKILPFLLNLLWALSFAASALLIKPFAAFLFLPLIYIFLRNKLNIKWLLTAVIFILIAVIPLILWRLWIANFPEGVPASEWLLNGDGIRFKGAFFYWLFADRLGRLILGYFGLPLLVLGILAKKVKEGWLYILWAVSMLLYITVFATGNVRHDYYQALTVPIVIIFLSKGAVFLINLGDTFKAKIKNAALLLVLIIFMEMFAWYHIRDFYNINHPEIVEAGKAVELKTTPKSLVIAPYDGDTAFLYQTQRAGWPVMQRSIEDMIKMGADYYTSVKFDDLTSQLYREATAENPALRKYKLIDESDKYVLIQLVPDKELPR